MSVTERLALAFGPATASADELHGGDNHEVLTGLLERLRGQVDLVYLDPPFGSQADYKRTVRLRTADARPPSFERVQYTDHWSGADYLRFMAERLRLCRALLGDRGVLFLHCDWHHSHRLRCLLDDLFGPENFQNEIIWHYYNKLQGNVGRFAANHDTILFYSCSSRFTFNRIRERRPEPIRQIQRVWSKDKRSIVNAKGADGKVTYVTSTHKTIDDVWRMSMLQPADRRELVGYPTQKPEALLERILAAATEPGALVLDPFMGSGTTGVVASKLGRRFIGVDRAPAAVHASLRRMLRTRASIAAGDGHASVRNGLDQLERSPRLDAGIAVYEPDGQDVGPQPPIALAIRDGQLVIEGFEPGPLLAAIRAQLPAFEHAVADDWRALVDAVFVDFAHDGEALRATEVDLPGPRERVRGRYPLPARVGTIAVCVVDLLGERWTGVLHFQ